jgi:diguanylate cyclase (GGDEF)-like protein
MSMMFPLPAAMEATPEAISWAQVMGLAQGRHKAFFARVRQVQVETLNRHVPFNVALLVCNLAAVLLLLGPAAPVPALAPWLGLMAGLACLWMARNLLMRQGKMRDRSRPATLWQITGEVALFSLAWAGIAAALMPELSGSGQALLVTEMLLVLGGTGFACAVTPAATLTASLFLGVGVMVAVPLESPLHSPILWLAVASYALLIGRGSIVSTRSLMGRLAAQFQVSEQSEVVRLLLNEFEANGSDWLLETDADARLTHVTARFADMARRPRADLLGLPMLELIDSRAAPAAVAGLRGAWAARRSFRDMAVPVLIEGERRWWSLSGTPKHDAAGNFTGYRGVGRDVTEARRSQERIAQLARFDPLTGLANRALFREMLDDAVARANRTGRPCGLLFIDLDRFKAVNDSLGHDAGDQLLVAVAGRLQHAVRGAATIARLGGDEFAVLIADASDGRADRVAARISRELAKPFGIAGQTVQSGASIGYALAPQDALQPDKLLKAADLALYQVKANGRGTALRFDTAMQFRADERRSLEADLAQALPRGELTLAFQPVVDAGDERVVGFEALLRWQHPERGPVPPLDFIPLAEETGLIVPIGAWVIDQALAAAANWPEHMRIAVNLSPAQMQDEGLVPMVAAALARHGVAADRLELEITERLFMADTPAITAALAGLRGLGVSFALDDFGTGYSSLGYLHKAAFSRIKIDRSFVQRASDTGSEAHAIIQTMVALAQSLDMDTTAEGTETRAEFETIRTLGCGQVQGYLFGRPMPLA